MTAAADIAPRLTTLAASLANKIRQLRLGDTVPYLTLFLIVSFPFSWWQFRLAAKVALLTVLLFPSAARSPTLWGVLAATTTVALVGAWDLANNHQYLVCYWLWVMCISYIPKDREFHDRIIRFNARFFLIFIFLAAALQKLFSSTYMSGSMFEMELLLDHRFHAFAHLVGIDYALTEESLRRLILLQNPFAQVVDNAVKLPADDRVHRVAILVTLYDLCIQIAIGTLLLFCRRSTDAAAHILLLLFIFTTYIAAPVFGFGVLLCVMGFALAKERFQLISAGYLLAMVAVLAYDMPWRDWVLGT